jgi:hypothetical protein
MFCGVPSQSVADSAMLRLPDRSRAVSHPAPEHVTAAVGETREDGSAEQIQDLGRRRGETAHLNPLANGDYATIPAEQCGTLPTRGTHRLHGCPDEDLDRHLALHATRLRPWLVGSTDDCRV